MNVRVVGTRYIAAFTHVVQSHLSVGAVNNIAQEFFWYIFVFICWFALLVLTLICLCVCAQFCVYI